MHYTLLWQPHFFIIPFINEINHWKGTVCVRVRANGPCARPALQLPIAIGTGISRCGGGSMNASTRNNANPHHGQLPQVSCCQGTSCLQHMLKNPFAAGVTYYIHTAHLAHDSSAELKRAAKPGTVVPVREPPHHRLRGH